MSRRVITFGTFDPLHEGHHDLFRQARAFGDELLVVVARDQTIRNAKGREPNTEEADRLAAVTSDSSVSDAQLGDEEPQKYALLHSLSFDVLALGYDQEPSDAEARTLLDVAGKTDVEVVRLQPFRPDEHKSSLLREVS